MSSIKVKLDDVFTELPPVSKVYKFEVLNFCKVFAGVDRIV